MYLQDYFGFLVGIVLCMIFSAIANNKVNSSYEKYDKVLARSGYTGSEAARQLMLAYGIYGISIGRTGGRLTDHYHPTKAIVNLSDSTYSSNSVAALAVAAHEIGHVMQKQTGYAFYNIRTALVPVVNFGSRLAMPLVLVGLLLDFSASVASPGIGFNIAMIGVALYGGSLLFALVTLPVELNASARAKKMLVEQGILHQNELEGADKVLGAAALTYLASLLTSLVYFLRFLLRVLAMFGRRNDR